MSAPFESALREAMRLLGALALPLLLAVLATGVVVGLLQSATRVRDRSISAVPRIVAVGAVALLCGGWAAARLVAFTTTTFQAAVHAGHAP